MTCFSFLLSSLELGGRIHRQLVQAALDHDSGVFFAQHATQRLEGGCIHANSITAECAPATPSITMADKSTESYTARGHW